MLRALYTGASGMSAQEMNLENVANNLANSSTAGFRKRRLQFEDLIYQNVVMPGAASTQRPRSQLVFRSGWEPAPRLLRLCKVKATSVRLATRLTWLSKARGSFK